jgi:1-deoxy-D-xylulose-5-phosphate reductoisomerase
MKNRIAILGSTGSIGKTVLDLIDKNNFKIILLSANKNYQKLLKQAKIFNVKNLVICDQESYKESLIYNKDKTIKIRNNFEQLNKIINKKLDYVMSSISGIDGLNPTFKIIKYTKKIAIANKESLICAWPIIKKELNKNKTDFIPVDSEHFSIWSEINNTDIKNIKKIYLTASGGPLLNYNFNKKKKIPRSLIFNHPTWKMGKKITVDSATMMNKCFEVMEAKNIFDLEYDKIDILTHPDSYVHSIIVYNNGISKLVTHDTTMKIPIFNSIFNNNKLYSPSTMLNLKKLNNLNLKKILSEKFPIIKILKNLPSKHSLFETVIVSVNDFFVDQFLQNKINFQDISILSVKAINDIKFNKFKKTIPKNINDVINLNHDIKYSLIKSEK